METLVAVAQHRSQYQSRGKGQTSKGFKGINCRTFQSGTGILPSPPAKACPFHSQILSKSPRVYSEPPKQARRSKPIPIIHPLPPKGITFNDDFASYSELWAGPAYSNSPPPSSLPMPKFSLRQKRSISLELTVPKSDVVLQPVSKSAPSSPTRESPSSSASDFQLFTATATENLRRILHLDD